MTLKKKITVVGCGYVGMSMSILISQKHSVISYDIDEDKILDIKNLKSPIVDKDISEFLETKDLDLDATSNKDRAFKDADFIIIATPTNFNSETNSFDTNTVRQVISDILDLNKKSLIVIKSTIPIGFTNELREYFNYENIIFSPEFLREGRSLYDNLYPERIIIGSNCKKAKTFGKILIDCAHKKNINVMHMSSSEAEAVKLFSNTYLAMRVAFFNELDSYAMSKNLNSKIILKGVSADNRIGDFYNNPSFGYGGYCLPKDSKQLLSQYHDVPQNIIKAIVDSNKTRINFIVESILKLSPKKVGIYRLIMKSNSDNFRSSAIDYVIDGLLSKKQEMIIYEPNILDTKYKGIKVENKLDSFKLESTLVIANRLTEEIKDCADIIFTRDVFNDN